MRGRGIGTGIARLGVGVRRWWARAGHRLTILSGPDDGLCHGLCHGLDAATAASALDLIPCAVAIVGANHRYRWLNERHRRLIGAPRSGLSALGELTAADDRDAELEALAPLHAGRGSLAVWRRRFGGDPGRRWCTVTAHARRQADDRLDAMVWLIEPDPLPDPAAGATGAGTVAGTGAGDELVLRRMRTEREQVAALLAHDGVQATRLISSFVGLIVRGLDRNTAAIDARHLDPIRQTSDQLRELLREALGYLRVPERVTCQAPVGLRHSAGAVVTRLGPTMPGLVLRVLTDLDVALDAEHFECCLGAALVFAWARARAGVVELSGSSQPGHQELAIVVPGGALQAGDAERCFQLGARFALGDRPGSVLPGLAVARRIAAASGGGLTISDAGGSLRISLRIGGGA